MNIRLNFKLMALLCLLIGVGCFLDARRKGRRPRSSSPQILQAELAEAQGPRIQVPKAGQEYSIGDLIDLINSRLKELGEKQTAHFIVPAAGSSYTTAQMIKHSECWPANGPHLTMGRSAAYPPISLNQTLLLNPMASSDTAIQNKYQAIRNTKVTLHADPVLINKLLSDNRLTTRDNLAARYGAVLLYFVYTADDGNQYRLYLEDVWPGRIVRRVGTSGQISETNPAALNLQSWAI